MTDADIVSAPSDKYEMPIYGDRPGDNAARQKKLAETLPEKPGIIAGRELRPGDKVPCRQGDIVAGVCKTGQTAKEASKQKEDEIKREAALLTTARLHEMFEVLLDMAHDQFSNTGRNYTKELMDLTAAYARSQGTDPYKEQQNMHQIIKQITNPLPIDQIDKGSITYLRTHNIK